MMNARGHPEPQRLLDYYRNQPQALEQFRPTVFEDKVIAFLAELATVSDEVVDVETLLRDPDEDEKHSHSEPAETDAEETATADEGESAAPDKSD